MQKATIFILVFTSLISLLEIPYSGIMDFFALTPALIGVRPWTLLSAIFVHVNLGHLVQNMTALLIFGSFLERVIKPSRWLLIYFASGVAGNMAGLIFYPGSMSLGASGAIMGLVGALTILRPKATVWFGAELPVAFLSAIFILTDFAGLLAPSNIGNAAHLAGFFAGACFGLIWKKKFSVAKEVRIRVSSAVKSRG